MGKKRIKEKSGEETAVKEEKHAPQTGSSGGRAGVVNILIIHIQATYNNTVITLANEKGEVLAWSSSGSLGFKGTKKSTPYAAARVADAVLEKINKMQIPRAIVLVKGLGSGRESAIRAVLNKGLNVTLIKDITPIPHNGPRPPKVRRV